MSKNTKVAIGVIVVLVLAGGAYYWYAHMMPAQATFVNTPATLPSGNDTSDQGLQQDTAAIDAQMKGLSTDQETVNSSVNAN